MNYKRRPSSSSSSTKCKKHTKHEQSVGVCSMCLRERLTKISRSSSRVATYASSSSSSCSLSSVSSISSVSSLSNTTSPMHECYRKGHISFFKSKLKKSKSMAFVSDQRMMEDDAKKKGGFWSKLMHSRTMREMLTTGV